MVSAMLTEVKIDSTDISDTRLLGWKITETFGQAVRECVIECSKNIYTDIPLLDSGKTITIKRGTTTATDQFVFDGYVDRIDKDGPKVIIYGKDKMIDLIRKSVTYSYDGVAFPSTEAKGSDIATDLIETWGEMTAEVVDTGSTVTLSKFICNGADVFTKLQELAEIYDYQIHYDPDDSKVHFEPKGYDERAEILYVGGANNNCSKVPRWIFDNSQCVNKLIVKGAVQEVRDTETFDGDGSANQVFTLGKKPISVEAYEGATLKTPGVPNSTSGTYHYTVDKENKKIKCTSSWAPAVGSDNVKVQYVASIPVPIEVLDEESQDKYGIYQAEKVFTDIQTVEDAEARGNSWLTKYANPFVRTTISPLNTYDYEAGHKVRVVDSLNNEDRWVVINKITKAYPHKGDQLVCGDKEFIIAEWGKFTLDRIRRLEEENQKNTDLLIQIRKFDLGTLYHKRRYSTMETRDMTGIPTWDSQNEMKWGSFTWSDGVLPSLVTERIVWPDQTYKETFMDEDFKDAGTANWDTTNKQLVFA